MYEKSEGKSKLATFKAGDVIFYEGDAEKVLYKILSGKITIYGAYGRAQQREIAVLEKGQCFGEMAILENAPRSATAVAVEDTHLMCYHEEILALFVKQNTAFFMDLLRSLSLRLRNTNHEMDEMYKLLLHYAKEPTLQKISKIEMYLRQHTVYDQDGNPQFAMKL